MGNYGGARPCKTRIPGDGASVSSRLTRGRTRHTGNGSAEAKRRGIRTNDSAWDNTFSARDEKRLRRELSRQQAFCDAQDWQMTLAWLLAYAAGILPNRQLNAVA